MHDVLAYDKSFVRVQRNVYSNVPMYTPCTHSCTTQLHTPTHTPALLNYTHSCTHSCTHTCTHLHTHTLAHSCTLMHTLMNTLLHTHLHTLLLTHLHTHLHTHLTHTPHTHSLEMLDKSEVPTIPDGYPLVVGMTALLDAVGSVASIVNDDTLLPSSEKPGKCTLAFLGVTCQIHVRLFSFRVVRIWRYLVAASFFASSLFPTLLGKGVKETMLSSSWSGALVAITHLLDAW